ncbi:MAG: SCO family protein [Isosphaeraceae bacterium]
MRIIGRSSGRTARRAGQALAALLVLASLSGCTGPEAPAPAPSTSRPPRVQAPTTDASPVEQADYHLEGVVRAVDPEGGRVLIRHKEIPGLMKAMTMPFEPENQAILGRLRPNDMVEGTLHVERQDGAVRDYRLRDLKVVKHATPSPTRVEAVRKAQSEGPPPLLKPGEPVPDFTMTDQDGGTRKLSDLRGKIVVLTFIYTRCPMPDFCPLMDRKFNELAEHLAAFPDRAAAVRLISLSFDPDHDTPDVLRKHAAMRGAQPPLWTYAVATRPELAKIAPRLGLFFAPDGQEIAHNLCTAVIGPDGRLARLAVGKGPNQWGTAELLKTIYPLIPGGAK